MCTNMCIFPQKNPKSEMCVKYAETCVAHSPPPCIHADTMYPQNPVQLISIPRASYEGEGGGEGVGGPPLSKEGGEGGVGVPPSPCISAAKPPEEKFWGGTG